jgi:ankyrin repeat protein
MDMRPLFHRLRFAAIARQVGLVLLLIGLVSCSHDTVFDAAQNGDLAKVKAFVQADSSLLSKKDSDGWTPLHWAAAYGQKDVAQFLLDSGAEINARDGKGETPLILAQLNGHKDLEDLLRQHGGQ